MVVCRYDEGACAGRSVAQAHKETTSGADADGVSLWVV